MKPRVKVIVQPGDQIELIAESIKEVAAGMKQINAGKLNKIAILVLLKHSTGLSMADISKVLGALADLERSYCK